METVVFAALAVLATGFAAAVGAAALAALSSVARAVRRPSPAARRAPSA